MIAVCVDPAKINEFWPHVSHFIKAACEYGDDTFETTEKDVLSGGALLWLAIQDSNKVLGAAVSKIWKSPKYKICSVLAVGGQDLHEWKDCLKAIETYAKNEECDLVRLSGREGWKRIFTDYEQPWIVLEKRI